MADMDGDGCVQVWVMWMRMSACKCGWLLMSMVDMDVGGCTHTSMGCFPKMQLMTLRQLQRNLAAQRSSQTHTCVHEDLLPENHASIACSALDACTWVKPHPSLTVTHPHCHAPSLSRTHRIHPSLSRTSLRIPHCHALHCAAHAFVKSAFPW